MSEHLISLGINPKVPPVELFSNHFIQQVQANKDPRAVASEMEHAIRKHCKVNEADDPVMYARFSEKLEQVLKKYNESWEQMVLALDQLRDEIDKGRGPEADNKGPFFDLLVSIAFDGSCPKGKVEACEKVVEMIMALLAEDIRNLNFWERPAQVSNLKGKLVSVFILSKVSEFKEHRDLLTTEVMALARRRERSILGDSIDTDNNAGEES